VPAGNGRIIGEARTEDRKQVRFFCLEERTGKSLWVEKDFGLGWWCGIEGISSTVVFLHGFASPDLPVHRSVYAVDIETGAMLWSAGELRFTFALPDAVYAQEDTPGGRLLREYDPRTGVPRRSWKEGDDLPAVPEGGTGTVEQGGPVFPVPLAQLKPEYPELEQLVESACASIGPGAAAEVLVERNLVIVGCTVLAGMDAATRSVSSSIHVIARHGGRLLYKEDISGRAGRHMPDAFFVRNDMLVYIRERTMLTGVDLAPAQNSMTGRNTR
jgi:hypothetical protein